MALLRPDPTFYPSPRMAVEGPPETVAYVALLNPTGDGRPDALAVVDVDSESSAYGREVGRVEMPNVGDELHHFGWNMCSSALCPSMPHPHTERRFLIVPGLRSSRLHILDTKPDPRSPRITKVIEPREVFERTGFRGRTPSTVGRTGCSSARWAIPRARGRAGYSSWITRRSS